MILGVLFDLMLEFKLYMRIDGYFLRELFKSGRVFERRGDDTISIKFEEETVLFFRMTLGNATSDRFFDILTFCFRSSVCQTKLFLFL